MILCLKKVFNGEITFYLKRLLKRLCYYKWNAWFKLLSASGLKKYYAPFYHHAPKVLLKGMKYRARNWSRSNTYSKKEQKFIFPWRKIRFRYTVLFVISEKSITRCTFIHGGGTRIKSLNKESLQKIFEPKFSILSALKN